MLPAIAIFLLALGGLGGSFQPARLLIIASGIFLGLKTSVKKNLIGFTPLIKKGLAVYLIWILYGLVTLLWTPDAFLGFTSEIIVMTLGMSSLVFFPFYFKNDESTIKLLCKSWAWSCILTLPVALYEIFTMNHFFYVDEERVLGGIGINAPFAATFFGNYNGYSVILCFYYPFLLISYFIERRKFYKIVYAIAILTTLFVVLINTSRGALLTVIIISLGALKFSLKKGLMAISLLGIIYFLLPPNIKTIINVVFGSRYGEGAGFGDDIRSNLLYSGFELFQRSYGLGMGAGAFEIEVPKTKHFTGMINPHNLFIEVFSQYGLVIFLLFNFWLFSIVKKLWKNKTIHHKVKQILLTTMFCIPIIGAINSAALGYTYWWLFFTSIAIIASVNSKSTKFNENR